MDDLKISISSLKNYIIEINHNGFSLDSSNFLIKITRSLSELEISLVDVNINNIDLVDQLTARIFFIEKFA